LDITNILPPLLSFTGGFFIPPPPISPPYTPPSLPVGVSPLPSLPLFSPIWGDNPLNVVWTENFYTKFLGKSSKYFSISFNQYFELVLPKTINLVSRLLFFKNNKI
jgi:hypothetical protein